MKSKNIKNVIYLFLTLMFCVAVSGGCGGGSSGHYSGNFGDSSQDVAPEPESQDVVPENPVSDDQNGDDYGANNGVDTLLKFKLLNKSRWKIDNVAIYGNGAISRTQGCEVISYSHNTETIQLFTFENSFEDCWCDDKDNYVWNDLTVTFKDPDDGTESEIPILRLTDGFKVTPGYERMNYSNFTKYIPRNDGTGENDQESININEMVGNFMKSDIAYQIQIINSGKGNNGQSYFAWLYLTRIDLENWESNGHTVYSGSFEKLSDTKWKILSVDVVGAFSEPGFYPTNTNGYNYDVSKITLMTNSNNNNGDLSGGLTWLDGNNNPPKVDTPLTIKFMDVLAEGQPEYTAPLLIPAIGFKYKGRHDNGTVEYQTTLPNGDTETIFQHDWNDSGQVRNPHIRINNSFTINGTNYSSNMVLVPAE